MKRLLSVILVVLMVFSVFVVPVSAATYETESNDSYSTADTLMLNDSIKGIMNNSNDVDVYKITTSSNGKLTLNFYHTHTDESNVIWWIYVYHYADGKYNQLSRIQINGYSDEKITFPEIGTVSSGVYYVKINTAYNNTTKYDYSIANTFTATEYYEKEINDSYSTATLIYTNKNFNGYMNNSDDVDIYKIVSTKSEKLTFEFSHIHTDESNVIWWIYVYHYVDGKYNQLSRNQVNGYSDEKVDFPSIMTEAGGVYYVKINTAYQNTTNYEYGIKAKTDVSTTYKLSYNANGGSGAPSSQTGKTTYTISSVKPTRSGYTFLGWSKSSSATSATYVPGDSITISSNTTLYAVWKKNSSSTTPTFTLTSENLVLKKGEYEDVALAVIWNGFNGKISVRYEIDGKSVCSLESGEWNNSKINLRIKGKDVGTAVVKLSMFDVDTGTIYYTKNIKVKVASPTIELSDKNVSVNVGEYIDLSIYCPKNGIDVKRTVTYTIGNEEVVSAEWLNWIDDNANLRIHGVSQGSTTIKLELTDTTTEELYDTETITVEVIDPTAVPVYTFWEWLVIIFLFGWIWYI